MSKARILLLCSGLLGAAGLLIGVQGLGLNATFEMDGDANKSAYDDWSALYANQANSAYKYSGLKTEPSSNSTIFTTGGSKDINDISQWKWKDEAGGLPDKDNLLNASAAAYRLGPAGSEELVIYAHADRFANDGDAQMGFWFLQKQVTTNTNGSFNGTHVNGDVLVLANFENGGASVKLEVLEWKNGALVQLANITNAKCGSGSALACGISNTTETDAPWPYQPKQGTQNKFPAFSFFEVAINISEVFAQASEPIVPCFASFLAETRSSTSANATLKDFVLGSFPVCDITVTKACTWGEDTSPSDPDGVGQIVEDGTKYLYPYKVTVTNTGFGSIYNVKLKDAVAGINDFIPIVASLAPGASYTFNGSFKTTVRNPTNTAIVTATLDQSATEAYFSKDAVDGCLAPEAPTDFLTVTKSCDKVEVVEDAASGKVVVKVHVKGLIKNESPVQFTDLTLKDLIPGEAAKSFPLSQTTLNPGASVGFEYSYLPKKITSGTSNPCAASFSDSAEVSGTGALGVGNKTVTSDAATCPLCACNP